MDDTTLSSLRAGGAMIGETNITSWEELLAAFKLEGLRWALPNAKREFDTRQVTATQLAKTMRHRLKCHEPERKKGEPLIAKAAAAAPSKARDADQVALDDAEAHGARVYRSTDKPAEPAPKAAEPVEHEPTEAAPARARGISKGIDYHALCAELGTFRITQLAKKADVRNQTAAKAVHTLVEKGLLVTLEPGNRKTRYRWHEAKPPTIDRVAEKLSLPKVGEAVAQVVADLKEHGAIEVDEEPAPKPDEPVCEQLSFGDSTEIRPGAVVHITSAVLVHEGDLGGELSPVLEKVIDAYVRRHGYVQTRSQLMRCAKLGL